MKMMTDSEIKEFILETQHKMILDTLIWESIDDERKSVELLAYISGINEMSQALIDEMCGDEDG